MFSGSQGATGSGVSPDPGYLLQTLTPLCNALSTVKSSSPLRNAGSQALSHSAAAESAHGQGLQWPCLGLVSLYSWISAFFAKEVFGVSVNGPRKW